MGGSLFLVCTGPHREVCCFTACGRAASRDDDLPCTTKMMDSASVNGMADNHKEEKS